jgi:DNA-binding transcriptional MerR regulator
VSERAYLSIGEVLQLLQEEFPDVTISKIRFLESQGLIDPERTPSGYRKFYDLDIERLKYILREQKDSYLPLKVIKDRLASGETTGPVVRPAHDEDHTDNGVPTSNGVFGADRPEPGAAAAPRIAGAAGSPNVPSGPVPGESRGPASPVEPSSGDSSATVTPKLALDPMPKGHHPSSGLPLSAGGSLTFEELVGASGLTPAQLREVERYGLLSGRPVGPTTYYDDEAVVIAKLAHGFLQFGIEPRHLRMYRNAADREAGLFEQVILPLVKQRNPKARGQALTHLDELTRLGSGLREAMVRQALRGYSESL